MSKRKPRRKRATNPAPKGFVLFARKGSGPRMHYNGAKFTTNGKPVVFQNVTSAADTGKFLVKAYPLLKRYGLTVEPSKGK